MAIITDGSTFLKHLPCSSCGSSDANSLYSDGHEYCHSCGTYKHPDGAESKSSQKDKPKELLSGTFKALLKRKITEDTCRKFGYCVGEYKGKPVQIAPYFNSSGKPVAQKIRFPDKTFTVVGNLKDAMLFGANLWDSGKKLVITEGEIDAMSVSQLQGNKWPVVSIPNGAQGARKALQKNIEYLSKFDEVILMFDSDEAGQKAVEECSDILPPGKLKIACLPLKDANECLVAGKAQDVTNAIWNAKTFRPDGIVGVDDLLDELDASVEEGLPWFLSTLTKLTYGRRWGDVIGLGAGTGIGKTDFLTQQLDYDITELGVRVGVIYLEQKPKETLFRIAGKHEGKRFHVPDGSWTKEERKAAVEKLSGKILLYDSFGQTEWETVKAKIRYMSYEGVKVIYLDHLTALADTSNEKESIEQIMKEMAGLAMELQLIIHFVSHLSTPEGKPHEEGGRVAIKHFKGSRSIGFWSYFLFGLERDQQNEDEVVRQTTVLRILKDRYTGQSTGHVIYLGYDCVTGRLFETSKPDAETAKAFKDADDSDLPF